jgi:hypothetical protein
VPPLQLAEDLVEHEDLGGAGEPPRDVEQVHP